MKVFFDLLFDICGLTDGWDPFTMCLETPLLPLKYRIPGERRFAEKATLIFTGFLVLRVPF